MGTFESSGRLKEVLGGFFEYLMTVDDMAKKLLASKMILKFNYSEPDLTITIDLKGEKAIITYNDTVTAPEVQMSMKADVAHRFWFGKVNLIMALARREMIAKGPIPKILKLLPVIKPAYDLYPKYLKEKWRILGVIAVSLMFFVHCGGEVTTTAFAQDAGQEGAVDVSYKDAAITSADGNVGVDAGFAGNGTTIEIPTGFTAAQCKFTAAAANLDGSAISTSVSINHETGEVICQKLVQERVEIPPETVDCVASYTVICVK